MAAASNDFKAIAPKLYSVDARHHHFGGNRLAVVILTMDTRWKDYGFSHHLLIRHLAKEMVDAIESGLLLVDRVHHPPGGLGGVGALEHDFLGLSVILPAATRFEIHWAEFPLFERIMYAAGKSKLLFVVGDGKPILDKLNAGTDQHFFELRHRTEELFILIVGAKAHYALDAGTIIPAAVEEHHLTSSGKVRRVALEIPLRALAIVRSGQRRDPADARIKSLGNTLYHATLARGVLFRLRLWNLPFRKHPILDFHLQFLVKTVDHLVVDALEDFVLVGRFHGFHWRANSVG